VVALCNALLNDQEDDDPRKTTPCPKRRKWARTPLLTPDEARRFRAAMRGLQGAFGSWPCLANAMGTNTDTIKDMMRGKTGVSGEMIVRASKASGLTLAELLDAPVLAGTCRACGAVRRAS
jgi:hypothetical protein